MAASISNCNCVVFCTIFLLFCGRNNVFADENRSEDDTLSSSQISWGSKLVTKLWTSAPCWYGVTFVTGVATLLLVIIWWNRNENEDQNVHVHMPDAAPARRPAEGRHQSPRPAMGGISQSRKKPVATGAAAANQNGDVTGRHQGLTSSPKHRLRILYGTQTGTAKHFAEDLAKQVASTGNAAEVVDLKTFDPESHILPETDGLVTCVLIVATYSEGKPTESAAWFCRWLEEATTDFRVHKSLLRGLKYAVFGLGNSLYEGHYNQVARDVDRWLSTLSASAIVARGEGDQNVAESKHGGIEADFEAWKTLLLQTLASNASICCSTEKQTCECGKTEGGCRQATEKESRNADKEEMYDSSSEDDNCDDDFIDDGSGDAKSKITQTNGLTDLEDLGKVMKKMKKAKESKASDKASEPREMITPMLRQALSKQGYRLIGSHSGVKLCRWTKSMLRGRGGCYKHTFYGIESHRCMETTPSLACANKCVFCWRHHTNPVGTEWRWKMDEPEAILKDALKNHYQLIKQFKGVPGVKPERMAEAMNVQHCALSLVGEPIMYPEINRFAKLLHSHKISTFLVTNAQFPDAIRSMVPVTQLYVSVDASTKESLKKIDRPLFRDFWPRFLSSLEALSEKGQRTVYRLTIVNGWNNEEIEAYANLVSIGKPDFIEVKGVTYCGESKASTLTMKNIPWHEEVVGFVQKLVDLLPDYAIASEHEHSNCVLAAHKKFKKDDEWWTWINYSRFHELIAEYEASDGERRFTAADYMSKTPAWAVFGCKEQGFDPSETRFRRKGKNKDISGC
ncbi:S-adenosyl-L-methionine-dependent tRNA 4-demethylwyosine synthase-like [Acanthaster planci]|uniref:S-adenosyl-L-methionine-dependent tRNA 4-demethylwyosine synthase TYW1 n=1 Tax=Acanthaster planci TaxID=133434 RepID=A0A8B7YWY7_ACAPL|nr:S-adenosyl-L-methionine-dependent tRNA 4-demethylwyosine synthase-like [Acanthaster planci]